MTIDERLEAIAQSIDALTDETTAAQERLRRLEYRDRRLRAALMKGLAAYLQAVEELTNDD
jgi:hypothetical protein